MVMLAIFPSPRGRRDRGHATARRPVLAWHGTTPYARLTPIQVPSVKRQPASSPECVFLHFALRLPALCVRGARRVQPEHEFREYDTKDNSAEVPLQVFGGVMETPNALASKNEFVP